MVSETGDAGVRSGRPDFDCEPIKVSGRIVVPYRPWWASSPTEEAFMKWRRWSLRTALLAIVLAAFVLSEFRPLGPSDVRSAALQSIADIRHRWAPERRFLPAEIDQVKQYSPGNWSVEFCKPIDDRGHDHLSVGFVGLGYDHWRRKYVWSRTFRAMSNPIRSAPQSDSDGQHDRRSHAAFDRLIDREGLRPRLAATK
jgi:hypothetical protein